MSSNPRLHAENPRLLPEHQLAPTVSGKPPSIWPNRETNSGSPVCVIRHRVAGNSWKEASTPLQPHYIP